MLAPIVKLTKIGDDLIQIECTGRTATTCSLDEVGAAAHDFLKEASLQRPTVGEGSESGMAEVPATVAMGSPKKVTTKKKAGGKK